MITSDNCAQANLLKTLLAEKIAEACEANDPEWGTGSYTEAERSSKVRTHEGDCWGHLRNTWFLGAAKAITKEVKMGLADDLENFILERMSVLVHLAVVELVAGQGPVVVLGRRGLVYTHTCPRRRRQVRRRRRSGRDFHCF